jgi:hypothetical protein
MRISRGDGISFCRRPSHGRAVARTSVNDKADRIFGKSDSRKSVRLHLFLILIRGIEGRHLAHHRPARFTHGASRASAGVPPTLRTPVCSIFTAFITKMLLPI